MCVSVKSNAERLLQLVEDVNKEGGHSHEHLGVVFLHCPFVFHFSGLCSLKPELCFLLRLGIGLATNCRIMYVCLRGWCSFFWSWRLKAWIFEWPLVACSFAHPHLPLWISNRYCWSCKKWKIRAKSSFLVIILKRRQRREGGRAKRNCL